MSNVEIKLDGLHALIKALKKSEKTFVKVGILGTHAGRADNSGKTNAEIGVIHEFGGAHMPQRSFLRVPITEHLNKELEKSGMFTQASLQKVISQKSLIPYLEKIGVSAEGIVSDAFKTGGFGKWKPSDMSRKKIKQTLVESQQLRNSISSEVVEG